MTEDKKQRIVKKLRLSMDILSDNDICPADCPGFRKKSSDQGCGLDRCMQVSYLLIECVKQQIEDET